MFFDVLRVAVKTALSRRSQRLQIFPRHKTPRLAEKASVTSMEAGTSPGIYVEYFVQD